MHHHLLYVASAEQINATKLALARLRAKELASDKSNSFATIFEVKHHVLGETILRVALLENIDHVVAHLRSQPVDILVYDERKGVEAIQALEKMKADIQGLADLWGPDFVFPFSRVVAILEKTRNQSHRAFELGRLRVRDVYVEPQQTAQVLRWIKDLLTHTIQRQNRIGVAMSGGGLEGFLFQMGCLFALELAVKGKSLSSAHVFSGVSSGSLAATILACKVPLVEVLRGVYRKSEVLPPLQSSVLFDFATKEIAMRAFSETLSWKGFDPTKWMTFLLKSLPTGFFKGERLQEYFKQVLALTKKETFEDLDSELYIGATDQDTFEHVVFGRAPWDKMELADAMRASCSLPPFFTPYEIGGRWFVDGQVTKTSDIELNVERGCRLVFVIDPMRPLTTRTPGYVDSQGGVYATIQTIKALVYSRFQESLKHIAERYPDVDFVVFQPDEESAEAMAGSPMRYRIRTQIIDLAFRCTLRRLRERYEVYQAKMSRYGFLLVSKEELLSYEKKSVEQLI